METPAGDANTSRPLRAKTRTSSHSLLATSTPANTGRKGRFAETGTSDGVGRASMSMPPPISKPSSVYRPSASRRPSNVLLSDELPKSDDKGNDKTISRGNTILEDSEKTPSLGGLDSRTAPKSCSSIALSDSAISDAKPPGTGLDVESNRLSFSSLFSLGSAVYNSATGGHSAPPSAASSNAGSVKSGKVEHSSGVNSISPSLGSYFGDGSAAATTATDPVSVITSNQVQHSVSTNTAHHSSQHAANTPAKQPDSRGSGALPRQQATGGRSRSRTQRRFSGSTGASSASPSSNDRVKPVNMGKIGVCALDVKARSKPSRNILTRLQNHGEFEVIVFGDKVILDEAVENWPLCDFLISFFSDGFPLDKAIAYTELRKPFCINDLPMQKVLWDRRICLKILDSMGVPTPSRIEVNRDGGPTLDSAELASHVYKVSGVKLEGPQNGTGGGTANTEDVALIDDGDTLQVDGATLKKPFVEKPVSGEDHNIRIYYPKSHEGGGARKLFRKIGNKSSEWDPNLIVPRAISEEQSSFIYEQFINVDNAEDVKAYTVGTDFCHAETRKSPVVDGLVRRNTHGKEIRYITALSKEEALMASKVAKGFGQRICGFDLLRVGSKSFVIDVNGWSFVKDNNEYYDKCANILKNMFIKEKEKGNPDRQQQILEKGAEISPEVSVPHRKETISHRAALKSIFRSPSLTKLTNHHNSHRNHGRGSPDLSTATVPLTSPPSLESRHALSVPSLPNKDSFPSPHAATEDWVDIADVPTVTSPDQTTAPTAPLPASKHSWKLKGMVAVIRHADRTPKQKFKFTFHTQPFVDLLRGHQEEVLLKGEAALNSVLAAVKVAMQEGIEDPEKLSLLRTSLARKGAWTGTKVQIKPMFRKRKSEESSPRSLGQDGEKSKQPEAGSLTASTEDDSKMTRSQTRSDSLAGITLSRFSAAENDLILDKLQLIIKWGGEPTHSARYQSQDLGENMRNDLLLMNREALENVRVFTSSERRVITSAQIWTASFLDKNDVPESFISVRKDLLDDSNAAKDVMDKVKKKLKLLLREGHEAPPQFAWPVNTPEPSAVVQKVTELMRFHRRVMRYNFSKFGTGGASASLAALDQPGGGSNNSGSAGRALAQAQAVASIQARWCCGEDEELFKERWEKLFSEFCDSEKVDPSKISELYDTMKFDALHNRQFLEWIFTPSASMLEEESTAEARQTNEGVTEEPSAVVDRQDQMNGGAIEKLAERAQTNNLAQRMGFRRKSSLHPSSPTAPIFSDESQQESYFKLFIGNGQTKAKQDVRLQKLRELYKLAKVLFDFICPQEYGIDDSEKLEIGLLTSLPLLKEIVANLEEVQASDDAKSFIYFTKESHIYTLLNCILEGGIKSKITRNAIPELDYLSQICFELYEAEDKDQDTFAYSIRIAITPGCHTADPLDVQLDSKHSIGNAPRRSLTAHQDWMQVIETLRARFHTVKLPKSFLAVNVSETHAAEVKAEGGGGGLMDD